MEYRFWRKAMQKIFGLVVIGLALASISPLHAQQAPRLRKIGFLIQSGGPSGSGSALIEAFRQGMRDLGYIEGHNIAIEYRSAERGTRLAELAAELVQQNVEIIVAAGPAVRAAKSATATIPIVFTY